MKRIEFDYQDKYEYAILGFSAYQVCVSRNRTQWRTFRYVLTRFEKKIDWYFDEWIAAFGFWERKVCLSGKKTEYFQVLALSVRKVCDARHFPGTFAEWCSADKNLIWTMIEEIEVERSRVFNRTIHTNMQLLTFSDNQSINPEINSSGFCSEESNAILDSRVAFYK